MIMPIAQIAGVAFEVIDELFTSDEERAAAKQALLKQKDQTTLKKLEISMSAIVAEAKSKDPWTSRARPSFLYVMYSVIMLCMAGGVIGIWHPDAVSQAASNIQALLAAIPDMLWGIFGAGYLGYGTMRSFDKKQMMKRTDAPNGVQW